MAHTSFDFKSEIMLVTFFGRLAIIREQFVQAGQAVDKRHNLDVLSRLVQRIRGVRLQFLEGGSWFLLHDHARLHSAVSIKQILAK
jgi:hypothetical protein